MVSYVTRRAWPPWQRRQEQGGGHASPIEKAKRCWISWAIETVLCTLAAACRAATGVGNGLTR